MVSRSIYYQLIFRIILIALSALLAAFLFFNQQYLLCGFISLVFIGQAYGLIYYVNQTNRKIAYFFDAIKNEDFTLRFPEKLSVKSLEELNHSLNMLNTMIQGIHLKKQAQEQYYQEILRQADIGLFTVNAKGHILYANPTVQNLLNYRPLNHIKQLKQIDPKLFDLFESLEPFESTVYSLGNERGKKELTLKCTPIIIEGQKLLLVVVHDIQKELDDKETDSWVKLIRVLTHEIMNSITPITSISESILKYFKKGNDLSSTEEIGEIQIKNTVKGLEVIKEQGNDLMSFVHSYRTFLSIPEPDRKLIPAQKILEKVKLLLEEYPRDNKIIIEIHIQPENLELYIDEKQITQVLLNLGKNAQQSIGDQDNGKIVIKAGIDMLEKKYIKISDNGPGIPPDLLDHIFVPFFTTKTTGSGIGLSFTKQIIRLHGGTLKVNSIAFKETSFDLIF